MLQTIIGIHINYNNIYLPELELKKSIRTTEASFLDLSIITEYKECNEKKHAFPYFIAQMPHLVDALEQQSDIYYTST